MKQKTIFTFLTGMLLLLCSCSTKTISISDIAIVPDEITVSLGESVTLDLQVSPSNADFDASWRSTDTEIASVDSKGTVTTHSSGEVIISATIQNRTATCKLKVAGGAPESIALDKSSLIMKTGETISLSATVLPEDAEYELSWTSSAPEVAAVDWNGTISAISNGNATITATAGELSAQCEVTVLGDPKKGDFYYSDGTYSTSLNEAKKVIGIVFWTGDPTEEDPALKREHPECSHGLVIAIKGENLSYWQSGYAKMTGTVGEWIEDNTEYESITTDTGINDNLNKIIGYNNTRGIELFNESEDNSGCEVEAMNVVKFFRMDQEMTAPETSSGWYLPSIKELSLLCSGEVGGNIWDISGETANRAEMNKRIEMVDGGVVINDQETYWSSSENTNDVAFGQFMYNGMIGNFYKNINYNYVRCVLAF